MEAARAGIFTRMLLDATRQAGRGVMVGEGAGLYVHPGGLECAVIGMPDGVRGEEVLAVVAPGTDD